jgi:type IV fimbrial biogenesis protein FimT
MTSTNKASDDVLRRGSRCGSRTGGFTLIEMMIAIAVLGLLLGLALPSFNDMIRNARVRAAAETYLGALNLARTEAIKRNVTVTFGLIDSDPKDISTTAPTYVATGTTSVRHWAVFVEDGGIRELLDSRIEAEGGGNAAANGISLTTDIPATPALSQVRLTFDALGRAVNLTGNARIDVALAGSACATDTAKGAGTVRCQRVVVSPAGAPRLCDPAVVSSSAARDPRQCP